MWTDYGTTCTTEEHPDCAGGPHANWLLHRLDTRAGQSGSGTYRYVPGSSPERVVWFVHVAWSGEGSASLAGGGTPYNRATRIRPFMFDSFCEFINDATVCP